MAVAVADVQEDALAGAQKTLQGLAKDPNQVLTHQTDVSDERSVLAFADAVAAKDMESIWGERLVVL